MPRRSTATPAPALTNTALRSSSKLLSSAVIGTLSAWDKACSVVSDAEMTPFSIFDIMPTEMLAALTTLQALSQALGVPMTALLRSFEEERSAVFVKAGAGVGVERRGTRAGHQYNLLGYIGSGSSAVSVEPYLITLASDTDTFPLFQHPGMEFLYLLEGEITYRHGANLYHMAPGDSLFFEADTPHGPEQLTRLPIRFLSIISYPQGGED